MGYFSKLADLGFVVICRRNRLTSTTMFAVKPEEMRTELVLGETFESYLSELLPEWRLVDFGGDDAAKGAQMLYEKLTCTGAYATWDERIGCYRDESGENSLLIGFEHRPESERFQPVE